MAHEVETMAYERAQVPWHGLGNPVNSNMSTDEMLIAAGLDWENSGEVLYVRRETPEGIRFQSLDELNADNTKYRGIIRQSDGYIHNIATADYSIIQNHEVMEFFREYVEAAGMTLETAGALKHGSLIWVLAKINKSFTLPGNDFSESYVLLSNSHDGTQEFNGQFTSVRVVCANTIRMAQSGKKGRSFSMRHSAKLTPEVIKAAKLHMGLAIETAEKYAQLAESLSLRAVTQQETLNFVAALAPVKVKVEDTAPKLLVANDDQQADYLASIGDMTRVGKAILMSIEYGPGAQLESAKGTAWGLLQGVTHYVDHEAGRNRDSALTSAWFGLGAGMKEKALDYVKALVS